MRPLAPGNALVCTPVPCQARDGVIGLAPSGFAHPVRTGVRSGVGGRQRLPQALALLLVVALERDLRLTPRKLRPAKINSAVRRRWFERRMVEQAYAACGEVADLGTSYGGWMVPLTRLQPGWTCYSIGAGGDISFDLELVRRYGMTVRCIEPVPGYVELARQTGAGYRGLSVHRAALALADGPLRMQQSHVEGSDSLSAARLYDNDTWVEVPGRSIESLMAELGDQRIELLKLDVEGAEYEWLPEVDLTELGVEVLCVQMH